MQSEQRKCVVHNSRMHYRVKGTRPKGKVENRAAKPRALEWYCPKCEAMATTEKKQ